MRSFSKSCFTSFECDAVSAETEQEESGKTVPEATAVKVQIERGPGCSPPVVNVNVGAIWGKVNPVGCAIVDAILQYLNEVSSCHLCALVLSWGF